jgi:WD40 repeat protein
MPDTPSPSQRDERLEQILADYLHAVEAGSAPDRAKLLKLHPDLAADLGSFFRNRDAMERIAEPIKDQSLALAETIGLSEVRAGAGTSIRYFGDYELLEEIARGGMGVVYRARQVSLNRIVAVKMILAGQLASEADVQRFKTEAEAAAGLDHPNIVPIYEVGEHEGQHYFSMKLVEGGSLAYQAGGGGPKSTISRQKQHWAAQLVATLARAVHHAHQRGILHRDLKPANVLLDSGGQPHITDFGLAKRVEGTSNLTQSGAIVGTPSYMAPEQVRAEKQLTTGVDVYSLGAILYELLTGRPPFQAATPFDILMLVLDHEPVPPSRLQPGVPRDLETICLKCLQKDPAKRYEGALALAEDLAHFQAGEPIHVRPVGRFERAAKWARRHKGLSAGLAAAVLGLLLGTAVATWQALEARLAAANEAAQRQAAEEEKGIADNARKNAEAEKKTADAARKNAEHEKKAADLARRDADKALQQAKKELFRFESMHYLDPIVAADQALLLNDFITARLRLDDCRWDLRHVEHAYLSKQLARKEPRLLPGHTSWVTCLALSPDGMRLYSGSEDKTIKVWDQETGKETLTLRGHTFGVTSLALSPDGKRLFSGSYDKTIKVWDLESGKEALTLNGHTSWVSRLALSADGKRLYSGGVEQEGPGEIKVWDLESGKEMRTLRGHRSWVSSLALSADGKRLFSGSKDDTIKVWDLEAGKETLTLYAHTLAVHSLALSPDGKQLYSGGGDQGRPGGEIKVWDLESGKETLTLRGHTSMVSSLALSADGKRLFSGSGDETIKVWDLESGKETLTLHGHTSWVSSLALSADGNRLFSGSIDTSIKVWDLVAAKETLTLRGHTSGVNSLVLSSDGKRLFSGSGDKTIKVWDLESGKETLTLRGHTSWVTSLALSADGRRLISGAGEEGKPGELKVRDL